MLIWLLRLFSLLGNDIVVAISMLGTMVTSDPSKSRLPLGCEPLLCLIFSDDLGIVGRYLIAKHILILVFGS